MGKKGKRLNMCPIAGGNWNNAANAGAFGLNLNNTRSNSNTNVAGRSDSKPQALKKECGIKGGAFLRLAQAFAKFAGRHFSSRHHVVLKRLGAFL